MVEHLGASATEAPVYDKSPFDFSGNDECLEQYRELRKCPVHYTQAAGGFYWLTRYEDVAAATRDKNFSSALKGVILPVNEKGPRIFALEQEAPDHMAAKRLYMEAFSPQCLKDLQPKLERAVHGLIDKFAETGRCDLTTDFAHPLPVLGVCAAIGVRDVSVDRIREVSSGFGNSETRMATIQALGELVIEELLERRANPTNDYLSRIANAELNGRKLEEWELGLFMTGFFTAGHETTTSTLASFLFHVLRRPDLAQRMMTDDNLLSAAIEETVRLNPPFHAFHRTTTQDMPVNGYTIPANSTVRLCFASANRDPEIFENPDEFNPERPIKPHFGFGGGRHVCAGAPLARLEIRTAFRVLLSRLPDIRPVSDQMEYHYLDGTFITPKSLPAVFTPA